MKTYKYALLVKNTPEMRLHQFSTIMNSPFMQTEFALMERQCYSNKPEKIRHIIYCDDIAALVELLHTYPSWYDYVNNQTKDMQGNIHGF